MNRLEKDLEDLAMHYAGKTGKLLGVIGNIKATLKTINDDKSNLEWAINEIKHSITKAEAIEKQQPES